MNRPIRPLAAMATALAHLTGWVAVVMACIWALAALGWAL